MRKRTVITTEKHEVWIIRQAAGKPAAKDQTPDDDAADEAAQVVPAVHEEPDKPLTQQRGTGGDN